VASTDCSRAYFQAPVLHLPLDARVFSSRRRLRSSALAGVRKWLRESPYALPHDAHAEIQDALWGLVDELNARPGAEFGISFRIGLNCL
jgi:hypothetical protein